MPVNHPEWRKASASNWNGNCVELAVQPAAVLIRDSKRPEDGHLTVTREAFSRFLADLRASARP